MSSIVIVGGVYHESCVWPEWDQIYGSAGRAAAALSGHVKSVALHGYARRDTEERIKALAKVYGFSFTPARSEQTISFEYFHSLSVPVIRPAASGIIKNKPIEISGDAVLRFGMMEGTARVTAEWCVYDPQSAFAPEPFGENGSKAKHLAIVGNRGEIAALGKDTDAIKAAQALLKSGAEVVVVKSGSAGAFVVDAQAVTPVAAYQSERVWKVGSGDVFAAVFASQWAVHKTPIVAAAQAASRAVAEYVNTMALPIASLGVLAKSPLPEANAAKGRIYLASPFFSLGERWVVDEARRCLCEFGLEVFSPVHDVGPGHGLDVAPADLAELDKCDAVFAILDGNDPGTVFEVGYARAKGKPIYALAQVVSDEDLKMIVGSDCKVFDDFVSALHHVAWRT